MIGHEKGINLNIEGAARGSGIDGALTAMLANNNGQNMWPILLVVLLGLFRGHGFGYGAGGAVAAGAANENGFFQILNQLTGISREIGSNATATNNIVDTNADRVISNNNVQSGFLTNNINSVQSAVSAGNAATAAAFSSLREGLCQSFAAVNTNLFNGFTGLSKEVGCLFNNLNTNLANQFTNLNSNLCNNFNQLYQQNAALNCAIDKLSCQIACTAKTTDALIVSSTDKILAAQATAALVEKNSDLEKQIADLKNAAFMNAFNTNHAILSGIAVKVGSTPSVV